MLCWAAVFGKRNAKIVCLFRKSLSDVVHFLRITEAASVGWGLDLTEWSCAYICAYVKKQRSQKSIMFGWLSPLRWTTCCGVLRMKEESCAAWIKRSLNWISILSFNQRNIKLFSWKATNIYMNKPFKIIALIVIAHSKKMLRIVLPRVIFHTLFSIKKKTFLYRRVWGSNFCRMLTTFVGKCPNIATEFHPNNNDARSKLYLSSDITSLLTKHSFTIYYIQSSNIEAFCAVNNAINGHVSQKENFPNRDAFLPKCLHQRRPRYPS